MPSAFTTPAEIEKISHTTRVPGHFRNRRYDAFEMRANSLEEALNFMLAAPGRVTLRLTTP